MLITSVINGEKIIFDVNSSKIISFFSKHDYAHNWDTFGVFQRNGIIFLTPNFSCTDIVQALFFKEIIQFRAENLFIISITFLN